jgi:hypothetical protein
MSVLDPVLKNEYAKRVYSTLGIRKPFAARQKTEHYRMPLLEESGGYKVLAPYDGPPVPPEEWTGLEYVTYPTDPSTYFAPLTSATGETVLRGFWDDGKPDLDGIWTSNAQKAPTLRRYVESIGSRYGRVQLIRQEPNSMREARWGLHLDDNNRLNPTSNGWVVRLWLELTDDPESGLLVRRDEFRRESEFRVPLPRYAQAMVDSEFLFHGGHHRGTATRYALITSLESSEHLNRWMAEHAARG